MSKFVVDSGVALRLAAEEREVPAKHTLLAPTLLRSQVLSALHDAVHAGRLDPKTGLERLARFNALSIRLLGDAMLRRRAWTVADELDWAETYTAEYIALTQLQADALVTLDRKLARAASRLVEVVGFDALA